MEVAQLRRDSRGIRGAANVWTRELRTSASENILLFGFLGSAFSQERCFTW